MPLLSRRLVGALVAGGLLVATVGCTGDDGGNAGDGSSTTAADPSEIDRGGVLRVGVLEPATLDPSVLSPGSHTDLVLADLLYDGLTAHGPGGEIQPSIAASWHPSSSFRTWRFELAKGRTFNGSKAITAADVKRTLERVASRGDGSFTAARLDVIDGYADLIAGRAKTLRGVVARGKSTVIVKLIGPMATFPELLSSPVYGITAQNAFANADAAPIPSSQFTLKASSANGFELTRITDAPGYVDGVTVRYFDDATQAYEALENDDLDWAPVPPDRVDDAADDFGDETFVPFQAELFLGMNVRYKAFAKSAFRKAIAAAIDREAIVEASYAGSAQPLGVIVPEGVPGHDPDQCGGLCAPDIKAAKAYLKKAYPKGDAPTVQVDVDDSDAQKRMAAIVVDNLKEAGIKARVRTHKFDEYKKFAVSGRQQLFSFGWIGVYDSPDAYLTPLFTKGGPDNVTGAASDSITKVVATARKDPSPANRLRLFARAERGIVSSAFLVPIAQFQALAATPDRVQGLVPHTDGTFDITKVWLSQD